MKRKSKALKFIIGLLLFYFVLNAGRIYVYSYEYHNHRADVAIVLGAGTNNGKVSPIYKERINHGLMLYNRGIVDYILLTGGYGKGQHQSDSRTAKNYALALGIPDTAILIEEVSQTTFENLEASKKILDALEVKNILLVSDPLHMKRAMLIATTCEIECSPSPTQTSMYRSPSTKLKQLLYESFYFSVRELIGIWE